jgi:hypothetical protein
MNSAATRLSDVLAGTELGPISVTVSAAANERYWASAGADHPLLRAGALYPPIAANLTILLFQTVAARGVLQTEQRIVCHRRGDAGQALTVAGSVRERFEKRGRQYAIVDAEVTLPDGAALWSSTATFCEP